MSAMNWVLWEEKKSLPERWIDGLYGVTKRRSSGKIIGLIFLRNILSWILFRVVIISSSSRSVDITLRAHWLWRQAFICYVVFKTKNFFELSDFRYLEKKSTARKIYIFVALAIGKRYLFSKDMYCFYVPDSAMSQQCNNNHDWHSPSPNRALREMDLDG